MKKIINLIKYFNSEKQYNIRLFIFMTLNINSYNSSVFIRHSKNLERLKNI